MTIEFDANEATRKTIYRILSTTVVPRPISWISTRHPERGDNLAPFSFFNVVCVEPPLIMFSPSAYTDGSKKDTLLNVLETEEFVHNLVTTSLGFQMHQTSTRLPPDQSEFDVFDIDRVEATTVDVPRVADALMALECTLHDAIELGSHTMVIGRVEWMHVDESIATDGKPDIDKVEILGRLSAGKYTTTEPHIEYEKVMENAFLDDEK